MAKIHHTAAILVRENKRRKIEDLLAVYTASIIRHACMLTYILDFYSIQCVFPLFAADGFKITTTEGIGRYESCELEIVYKRSI